MSVRLLEVAQQELDDAIAYYNAQASGLGDAFLLETVAAIDRIRGFPHVASARRQHAPLSATPLSLRADLP